VLAKARGAVVADAGAAFTDALFAEQVAEGPRADAGGEAAAVLRYEVQGVPYVFYARKPDAAAAAAAKPFKPYRCAQRGARTLRSRLAGRLGVAA